MIAGAVLAAGQSKRLGRPKQLLPFRGRPLLESVLAAMAASKVDATFVVLGHEAARVRHDVDLHGAIVVINDRFAEGISTSLQAALVAASESTDAIVIAVGDQPLLRADVIDALIDAHCTTGAAIVAADYGDHLGTPMLLHRSMWPLAQDIGGDEGARALLRLYPDRVGTVPVRAEVGIDVDSWDDYRRATTN